jgi:hypothetical protein
MNCISWRMPSIVGKGKLHAIRDIFFVGQTGIRFEVSQ